MKRLLIAALLLATPLAAKAPPVSGPGMVSAADPRAAAAGAEMLRAGGTATDAAIATMIALTVVEATNSGIGGGGFFVHNDGKTGATDTLDGREAAPAAADDHWFYAPDGTPLTHSQAVPGGRSVGVPGELRMAALAHQRHGKLPWARLFQPAIRLAEDGYLVTPRMRSRIMDSGRVVDAWGAAFLHGPDGSARPVGTRLKNPELAALLRRIAAEGPDAFYKGATSAKLIATVNSAARNPSKMTQADLDAYQAKARAPVCGTYRGYRICGMGPPSSGGVAVLAILKQLERFDMAKLGKNSPVAWHLFAESSRLAYADRDAYLGDPDKVSVPVAGLLDPAYLAKRSALLSETATMASVAPGDPAGAPARVRVTGSEPGGTSHLVAVDKWGDVASVTQTIESPWGSGLTMDGLFLNNELTDFDIVPVRNGALVANRVEGGKRPRSSMAPTIVYNPDGTVRIAIGAAGGSTIIAQVAKAMVAVLDWHMPAEQAIALGLVYAPGPTAILEQGTQAEKMQAALVALGEKVAVAPLGLKANAVERVHGRWVGAPDARSEGAAVAENGKIVAGKGNVAKAGLPPE